MKIVKIKALLTSDNDEMMTSSQERQLVYLGEAAIRKGLKIINPSKVAAQRIHSRGNELVNAVIDKMRDLSLELPELPCFGLVDWQKFYNMTFTQKQVSAIEKFPWSKKLLDSPCPFYRGKTIRETHFGFLGLDVINIMELQKLNPRGTEPHFYSYAPGAWYSQQGFTRNITLSFRWYLLLKEIVPNSKSRTFDDQKTMLPNEYEVPSAIMETTKDVLVYKKTGAYVNSSCYARTADSSSDMSRVHVGLCNAKGIIISSNLDTHIHDDIGIGASRKPEILK